MAPFGLISIFERHGEDIRRTHFQDEAEALEAWKLLLSTHPLWHREVSRGWSKKMNHRYIATLFYEVSEMTLVMWPKHIYALELWDRSLWSKDDPV